MLHCLQKKSTIHVLLQNMCVYVCCCVHVCTLTNPIYLCWQSALLIFSSYVQFFQSNTIMDQFLLYICRVLFFLHCKESHCTFCLLIWKNYRYGDLRVSLYIPFLYTHLICHTSFVQQVSSYIPFFYIHIWFATLCLYTKISSFYYMPKHYYNYRTLMYSLDSYKLSFIAAEKLQIFFFSLFPTTVVASHKKTYSG